VLLYLATGKLPWQGLKEEAGGWARSTKILELKKGADIGAICQDSAVGEAIREHIRYGRSLQYVDRPDYSYLTGLYVKVMQQNEFEVDRVWDWTSKPLNVSRTTLFMKHLGQGASTSTGDIDGDMHQGTTRNDVKKSSVCVCAIA